MTRGTHFMARFTTDSASTLGLNCPGAHVGDDGVRYCVWAPLHAELEIRIRRAATGGEITFGMERQDNGYFALEDREGRAGDRYLFVLRDGSALPDPASRFQPEGVHRWSECVDSRAYSWQCHSWQRPRWHGQSIYELHVGTFTSGGTFRAAIERLEQVAALGVEAIEIMPVADFPGGRNWGYDGVALFAPARCYGQPDDLRALVDAAHAHGLAVILDVVYNHLGPDGNYLSRFSDAYFHAQRDTPWGQGFNLDGAESRPVREFFLSNLVYWLDEFRFDGLRLDATHALHDESERHLLAEMAKVAHERSAFLIAEDERNSCAILTRTDGSGAHLDAAWADDFHHQVRVALTGLQDGYFRAYSGLPNDLARTLNDGWFYTGQPSVAWKGRPRGESCRHLPTSAFVTCIENHDQVGNRALGERLEHLVSPAAFRAASALLCLAPYPPLIFMGQEWAASTPFLFFTDHAGELGRLVSEGRRKEFASVGINQHLAPEDVPDPQAPDTFLNSKLRWEERSSAHHAAVLELYRVCLGFRKTWLTEQARERDSWSVTAFRSGVVLRYRPPGQPERLVVSSLSGDARLSLEKDSGFNPPSDCRWHVEFDSRGFEERAVIKDELHLDEPATLVLVAQPVPGALSR